jgi:L-ascorbate metabolism protein UlaG (beta-lactamase superfamily)
MEITKYEHACIVLEKDGQRLVIDPGSFAASGATLKNFDSIAGIVITHNHADHLNKELVGKILEANPDAVVVTVQEAANELDHSKIEIVDAGDDKTVGPFKLEFFGGKHAYIHNEMPKAQNVGVFVNETLYYPGDSFSVPGSKAVPVAAVPVSGPWMKIGEALDYIAAVKPAKVFPAHDGFLSEGGQYFTDNWLAGLENLEYLPLKPGDSTDI